MFVSDSITIDSAYGVYMNEATRDSLHVIEQTRMFNTFVSLSLLVILIWIVYAMFKKRKER